MKSARALLIFLILTTIVTAIFSLFSDSVANSIPDSWKPYIVPGFIISLLILIGLGVWQFWIEHPPQLPHSIEKPPLENENSLHRELPLSETQAKQIAAIVAGTNAIYGDIEKAVSTAEVAKRKAYEQKYLAKSITEYVKQLELFIEEARKGAERDNPYKELLEYDIRDIALFYGRSEAINELLELTENNSLTILHAESGAGKTSLLKAGIRPRLLANGHVPVYINLRGLSPNISIQKTIKQSLLPEIEDHSSLANASLHTFLRETTSWLGKKWLVVIIDQFEEIFTTQKAEARASFVQEFAACLNDDLLPVRWILSLRGELVYQVGAFRSYIPYPLRNEYLLRPLSREEARQAILEPARQQGVDFDVQLVEDILRDLGESIYPPQLQLVCSELFKAREENSIITLQAYETLGRTHGILSEYLHRVLNRGIPQNQRILAQRILVALVTSDKRASARTKDELKDELDAQGTDVTSLDEVISQLIDSRLLRVIESDVGTSSYLLAHEYLIDKVELDQESERRKRAQELIEQKIPHFDRDGLTLSPDELALILPHERWLSLTEKAHKLINQSKRKMQVRWAQIILISFIAASLFIVVFYFILDSPVKILPTITISPPSTIPSSGGMSIIYIFWMYVMLFSLIGGMRGWAKELLITFSVILALAFNHILRRYIPIAATLPESDVTLFWVRTIILIVLVFFGYQTVITIPHLASRATRERLQDSLFGVILGAFNGYLVAGTILFYMHIADYPFQNVISKPTHPAMLESVNQMMLYMPPLLLGEPGIYFAIILAFVFVLVVYI